jgi:hypothetical protein
MEMSLVCGYLRFSTRYPRTSRLPTIIAAGDSSPSMLGEVENELSELSLGYSHRKERAKQQGSAGDV